MYLPALKKKSSFDKDSPLKAAVVHNRLQRTCSEQLFYKKLFKLEDRPVKNIGIECIPDD